MLNKKTPTNISYFNDKLSPLIRKVLKIDTNLFHKHFEKFN